MSEKVVGTNDCVGGKIISIASNEIILEKNGQTFRLDIEEESEYRSIECEGGCCSCSWDNRSYPYFVAREIV